PGRGLAFPGPKHRCHPGSVNGLQKSRIPKDWLANWLQSAAEEYARAYGPEFDRRKPIPAVIRRRRDGRSDSVLSPRLREPGHDENQPVQRVALHHRSAGGGVGNHNNRWIPGPPAGGGVPDAIEPR